MPGATDNIEAGSIRANGLRFHSWYIFFFQSRWAEASENLMRAAWEHCRRIVKGK